MQEILAEYRRLLGGIDDWYAGCIERSGGQIVCRPGCSGCCRGLFEISLLDAALLQSGFAELAESVKEQVLVNARLRVNDLQQRWPEFQAPYILNPLPNDEWQNMPENDLTPCPLLGADGNCLVYQSRPLTCRLHGLPNIDCSGESFSDDWCTLNFVGSNPLHRAELRYPFRDAFAREFELLGLFAQQLTGRRQLELDTFVPSGLLINFSTDF
ncbi:YkgJ family cysteine cluster protein [Pelovirga terrestris]|uniref:YkgJ family cysteine cluster protein n=1 Tax=Pelovirga terrestris TaxID=2771352 RepID=A0A8J6UP45_9BACT|nr:YkgJ family cysteine cluster protein [Pelovirga terrestris]MBD1400379.1 YkgJ family cysteine cluster protein [Pelovirga terrestris]